MCFSVAFGGDYTGRWWNRTVRVQVNGLIRRACVMIYSFGWLEEDSGGVDSATVGEGVKEELNGALWSART